MNIIQYDRNKAINYAKKWAYLRNPSYYNFDNIGGDCTNFVSQCIYAGCNIMNYNKENGWYYNNLNSRSPSWTSVEELYNFLTRNLYEGPSGIGCSNYKLQLGDIVQLKFDKEYFSHSAIITKIIDINNLGEIYVSAHTIDSLDRRINSYKYNEIRFIHIEKIRKK